MNTILKTALAGAILLGSVLPAFGEDVYFTLINESSRSLHYFYASPSESTGWGPDLLRGGHTLRAGYNGTVTIADGSDECLYDFKFIMGDSSETIVSEIDLCSLGSYTIYD